MSCTLRAGRTLDGRAGEVDASWTPREGGCLTLRRGGVAARLDVEIHGRVGGEELVLRQSEDVQPRLVPLEEGPERLGVRSLWSLVDRFDTGYGEAMQEVYVTRHGEVFVALAVRIVTRADLVVDRAALRLDVEGELAATDGELLARAGDDCLLVTWPRGRGRRFDTLLWRQAHAPFYERWPPLFDQWSLDDATYGWERFPGAGAAVDPAGGRASLAWADGAAVPASPQLDLRGLVWLGLGAEEEIRRAAAAHEQPLEPRVDGGRLRCYDELDGAYEVAVDAGDACTVEFPPDPLARPLRVRVFGLEARGGFDVEPEAELLLLSERGRVDDPLVWVEVDADRRADEALVALRAHPDRATRISLRPREGLHVAYQRRDPRRRLTVHHPADLERPLVTLDLASLHLVDVRRPGGARPAIFDAPLFWMRYLPKAAAHIANRLVTFEIVESSPELVAVDVESETPDRLVRSRYRVEVPYHPDHVEVRIRAELGGAASWGLPTFEFADVFPEDGIDPAHWEYDTIAFVGADGVRLVETRQPYPGLAERLPFPVSVLEALPAGHALPDCGPWNFHGTNAVVFGGSERGTIVALSTNADPDRLEHLATLCEHWADVHFDAAAVGSRPVASEASARAPLGETPPVPDVLRAELTLRVHDPRYLPFEDAVAAACAEVAPLAVARA